MSCNYTFCSTKCPSDCGTKSTKYSTRLQASSKFPIASEKLSNLSLQLWGYHGWSLKSSSQGTISRNDPQRIMRNQLFYTTSPARCWSFALSFSTMLSLLNGANVAHLSASSVRAGVVAGCKAGTQTTYLHLRCDHICWCK